MVLTTPIHKQTCSFMEDIMKTLYVTLAILILAGCNSQNLGTDTSPAEISMSKTAQDVLQSNCEAKSGYYSKTLGCFE